MTEIDSVTSGATIYAGEHAIVDEVTSGGIVIARRVRVDEVHSGGLVVAETVTGLDRKGVSSGGAVICSKSMGGLHNGLVTYREQLEAELSKTETETFCKGIKKKIARVEKLIERHEEGKLFSSQS